MQLAVIAALHANIWNSNPVVDKLKADVLEFCNSSLFDEIIASAGKKSCGKQHGTKRGGYRSGDLYLVTK
jgi:hypothetical protein